MNEKILTTTKNGRKVYVDVNSSHASTHLQDSPELIGQIKSILIRTEVSGDNVAFQTDIDTAIGKSDLVETSDKDEIIYAKRKNRDIYTRFVKNREPVDTNFVTIILHKREDEDYNLFSAWVGPLVPPFPGDKMEHPDSKEFWSNHALVWGNQEIQPGTETTKQPW